MSHSDRSPKSTHAKTKRLFVAVCLPSAVERHLDEHIDGVRTAHPELRWVKPARWHLTCEFLGRCGPHEQERQVRRWARRARDSRPLQLRLAAAGTYPKKQWMARVLWVGLDGDTDAWTSLAAHGQEPHMTLARARERADMTGLVDELGGYAGPWWTATEITLMESHLRGAGDRGPRYEPLETFPLGGEE